MHGGERMTVIVSSTEAQNNFGKYLTLSQQEDVFISRNGVTVARLTAVKVHAIDRMPIPDVGVVAERAEPYGTGGTLGGRPATFEEFLALTKDNEERYEYIDGKIYAMASPRASHQIALMELAVIFYNWFQGKPCRPFVAPFDIQLRRSQEKMNVVQPDLMVICDLEEHLSADDFYKGVPALVIEILSASTRSKDMVAKMDLYMSCGVQEYWVVNPFAKEIAVYRFENKEIADNATFKTGEAALSFVYEGLSVELDRIFR